MKKAFVTGAGGYIGTALIRFLLAQGIEVTVLVRNRDSLSGDLIEQVRIIEGDAADIVLLTEQLGNDYEVFYHLAWHGVTPNLRNDLPVQMNNVTMSIECVKAAAALSVSRFIFLGSTMEYLYYGKPINEQAVPSSSNFYGATKIAAHYVCAELARQLGVGFIYAAVTSVYGVGREDNNVIFYVIDKLLKREKPSVTKLEQIWDYIHIDDLTGALHAIGEKGKAGAFYSLGKGENHPLSAYLEIVRDLIDPSLPLGIGEVPYASGQIPSSNIDLTSLERDTGFVPSISFREGIAPVIDFYKHKRSQTNEL